MNPTDRTIVVVVAHFEPKAAYIENVLASRLARLARVSVLTGSLGNAAFSDITSQDSRHELVWSGDARVLNVLFSFRQRVVARRVRHALDEIRPDAMVLLGPSQLLPLQVALYARRRRIPYVVIAGENQQQGPSSWLGKAARTQYARHFLVPLYGWIAKGSRGLIALTPETRDMAAVKAGKAVRLRALPYDDNSVRYDEALGQSWRRQCGWGMPDWIVLFQGKFERRKDIIGLISEFDNFAANSPRARLVLVGAGTGTYSNEVRATAAASPHAARISVLPFMSQVGLRGLMNAADVAIWPHVSAGITQTMGAGVFALTARSPVADFLTSGDASTLGRVYQQGAGGLHHVLASVDFDDLRKSRADRAQRAKELYSVTHFSELLWQLLRPDGVELSE